MEEENICSFKVIACSSEDGHSSRNVATTELDEVWLTGGEENKATILLELQDSCVINTVEIVNAGSMIVEIFASNLNNTDEETLLPSSILMTIGEVNKEENTNRVRFFGQDKLTKGVAERSWKYLRVNCENPNTGRKYGLARIKVFDKPPSADYVAKSISDNKASLTSVSFQQQQTAEKPCFRRTKSLAAVPEKSTKAESPKKPPKRKRQIENDDYDEEIDDNRNNNYNNNNNNNSNNKKNNSNDNKSSSSEKNALQRSSSSISVTPKKIPPGAAKAKSLVFTPFNKLMNDVIIVISGIANPERQELRDKAIEMGAQYLPDWIDSATHLICCFTNTPKFLSAQKSGGSIVTPGWITDCYAEKSRLPETAYLLSSASPSRSNVAMKSTMGSMRDWLSTLKIPKKASDSSEDAPIPNATKKGLPKSFTFIDNKRVATEADDNSNNNNEDADTVEDADSDTTEPMSDTAHLSLINNSTRGANRSKSFSIGQNSSFQATPIQRSGSGVGGSGLTDTTEDMKLDLVEFSKSLNKQGTKKIKLDSSLDCKPIDTESHFDTSTPLPKYFKGVRAVLYGNFDPVLQSLLFRYVNAYSGDVDPSVSGSTSHVITNKIWDKELRDMKDEYPSVFIVRPSWVFDSHNEQRHVEEALHTVAN